MDSSCDSGDSSAVLEPTPTTHDALPQHPPTPSFSLPHPTALPRHLVQVHFRAESPSQHAIFHTLFPDPDAMLRTAVNTVLDLLYPYPLVAMRPRKVLTLVFEDFEGVAFTTNGEELESAERGGNDGEGGVIEASVGEHEQEQRRRRKEKKRHAPRRSTAEIHLSSRYVHACLHNSTAKPPRTLTAQPSILSVLHELHGVIVHESVHAFQHSGRGPGGSAEWALIEGIADFIRLRAGLGATHWKRRPGGAWTAGYECTGYFLEWLDRRRPGFVVWLNGVMGQGWYEGVWRDGAGAEVDELWKMYQDELTRTEPTTEMAEPFPALPTEAASPP
ncbi:peptidase of plants and bacteria-domain-containing protein [Powellomyces hirtus]|nr:peptidase of plants and bacteria-domain-containing protein [Powellomyces hirtus]